MPLVGGLGDFDDATRKVSDCRLSFCWSELDACISSANRDSPLAFVRSGTESRRDHNMSRCRHVQGIKVEPGQM